MTYFADLSDYVYIPDFYRPGTLNVGWLDAANAFPQRAPLGESLDYLWRYCKISIAQTRGIHECELCEEESYHASRGNEYLLLGAAEIRVFAGDSIYAAPTMLYHYMISHHYCPPASFIEALHRAPAPPDAEYFSNLERLNLEWSKTASVKSERRRWPFV